MKISVIIPVYNGARYLAETLDSVFAQTLAAFEVIVVDDGSRDSTPEILHAHGDRLTVIRQKNQGVAAARNAGLARATGEAIAFLDQDDLWPVDRNRLMAELLSAAPDADLVAGMVRMLDVRTNRRDRYVNLETVPREMLVGSLLVRARLFARIGTFSTTVGSSDDTDFLLRRRENDVPTLRIREITLVYRVHDHNASADVPATHNHMFSMFHEALKRRRGAGQ